MKSCRIGILFSAMFSPMGFMFNSDVSVFHPAFSRSWVSAGTPFHAGGSETFSVSGYFGG
jgi:hypothetical protein